MRIVPAFEGSPYSRPAAETLERHAHGPHNVPVVNMTAAVVSGIGRRGTSRFDRSLLGSVSQKVSAYAGCSVLVVR